MDVFKFIEFISVSKTVASPVPAEMLLPEQVKPYKAKLDFASSGNRGWLQTVVMVDGEVLDHCHGARSAEEIARRLIAIQAGEASPCSRCLARRHSDNSTLSRCERPAGPS